MQCGLMMRASVRLHWQFSRAVPHLCGSASVGRQQAENMQHSGATSGVKSRAVAEWTSHWLQQTP